MLSELTGGRVPSPAAAAVDGRPGGEAGLLEALQRFRHPVYPERLGPPSEALLDRLDADDVSELRTRVTPELERFWDLASPVTQEHLKLVLGVHCGVAPILEKTGLRPDAPPEDVHAMGRGPLAAGGDFWIADLLVDAAERCGRRFPPGARVLDFGCSSGRHLRVLQAWRPVVRWTGCDPNRPAIEWASTHLPGIEFFVSPQEPPLDLEPASLDLAFAVSVWSHLAPEPAERWLAELHRLIRPGGLLVLTVQGLASVAHYLRIDAIEPPAAILAVQDLLSTGHHYLDAFGPDGDWGVASPDWGMAYMTLEWLTQRAAPDWSLALYEAARLDTNQDLVVLAREDGR